MSNRLPLNVDRWFPLALVVSATALSAAACGAGNDASTCASSSCGAGADTVSPGTSATDAGATTTTTSTSRPSAYADAGPTSSACTAIAALHLSASSGTSVSLAWTGAPDAAITVNRKTYCGTDDYVPLATLPAGTSSYTDTTATTNWVYWYEIVATDSTGASVATAIDVWAGTTTAAGGCSGGAAPQSSGVEANACTTPGGTSPADGGTDGSTGTTNADGGSPGGPSGAPHPTPQGTTFPISAGATTDTIQSTINTAAASGATSTVLFAPGTYSITKPISVPCPRAEMVISGAPVDYPALPTTKLVSGTPSWVFSYATCSAPQALEYLDVDGHRPSPDGGGSVYLANVSNLTITNNYLHGNQGTPPWGQNDDTLIWLDGYENGFTDSNDTIAWNIFGNPVAGDCSLAMDWFNAGGQGYDAAGGFCAAVGVHTSTTNLVITNNVIQQQEQGLKFYEGGSALPNLYIEGNDVVSYNDFSFIHRIVAEDQQSAIPSVSSASITFAYNDVHDQTDPAWGSWGFSVPMGGIDDQIGNVMIANVKSSSYIPGAFEWWNGGNGVDASSATITGNLVQGWWACGVQWGYAKGSITGNTIQLPSACYTNSEENVMVADGPSTTGNAESSAVSAVASTAPSVSFGGGMATIANAAKNTASFYTADGSDPVPGAGTALRYRAPFAVGSGTVVKAVGMWGAANQPLKYPSGYGYVPSGVVTGTAP